MSETTERRCAECGATLLPGRRFCIACQAPVPGASRLPEGQLAEISRHIPSTHRPDETLVFVPERREARLKREHRRRRLLIALAVSVVVLATGAFVLSRLNQRKQEQARLKRREMMAQRELELYSKALEFFYADVGRYPTPQEGLSVLIKRPPSFTNWRGPYIDGDYSVDPWGNEYVYQVLGEGAGYELFTYGPEGEASKRPFLRVNSARPEPSASPNR